MIETFLQPLPHGISLSCRAAGVRGLPVLVFLHGFPEGAFVWDDLLLHFAAKGFRCVAPNLRGYAGSSAPTDVAAYRPKHLVQDIAALIAIESPGQPLACLVAHDWGGAVAWNLANQMPQLMRKLAILNSPHPGTFLRELKASPRQQAASAYMHFLVQPDAESLLAANDFALLWPFLTGAADGKAPWVSQAAPRRAAWLTEAVKDQYRAVWRGGLIGPCNYYRASPLRPPRPGDAGATAIELPRSMLTISLPTQVIWGMDDTALPPELIDGLDDYILQLDLQRVEGSTHWIVHEQPARVAQLLGDFIP